MVVGLGNNGRTGKGQRISRSTRIRCSLRNEIGAGVQGINEHAASRYKVYVRVDVWSRGQAYAGYIAIIKKEGDVCMQTGSV